MPHWTWPDRKGKVTPVYCYTSYPSAELFVNGKSQGRISKDPASRLDRYRLRWNDVKYKAGEIKVVAYDENGNVAETKTIRTVGKPVGIKATADRTTLTAGNEDLAFVTVELVDKNGTPCPTASNEMTFKVEGAAVYRASCNGDATSLIPFNSTTMPLFSGQLVVVVEAKHKGEATLTVSTKGLPDTTVSFNIK